jgi:mRNA-degrading endonuclease YafQ of YafQ-DinJ toxin-antitoxin module
MKNKTPKNYRTKLPHELFQLCEEAEGVPERVKLLQEHATFGIKTLLQANYKEAIEFDLPEGTPPYKENEAVPGNQSRHFEKLVKQLKHLIKHSPLSAYKKETIYIKLLESLSAEDAKIMIAVKDKNLKGLYKTLTEATVRKAFPTLLGNK